MPTLPITAAKYIDDALTSVPGIKVLLMDADTKRVVSAIYSQSVLLSRNVVLVDMLSRLDRRHMKYLNCVVLARPTPQSISELAAEVTTSNFAEYHIFFTNMVEAESLQALAMADVSHSIMNVSEVFCDVVPLDEMCAAVPIAPETSVMSHQLDRNPLVYDEWSDAEFTRASQGIAALLLMLKRRPAVRYRGGSEACRRIARDLSEKMIALQYNFPDLPSSDCVVVVLDRRDDPVTPLLTQWSYQAMIHQFIGLGDGCKVVLEDSPGFVVVGTNACSKAEDQIHILSLAHDDFYAKFRHSDWGETCQGIKKVIEDYQTETEQQPDRKTATLEDIKTFVAKALDHTKDSLLSKSAIVLRHGAIIARIGDDIKARNLINLSPLEQSIAAKEAHSTHAEAVMDAAKDPENDLHDTLRLCLLYALRYQSRSENIITPLKEVLHSRGLSNEQISLFDRLLGYSGVGQRIGNIFKPNEKSSIIETFVKAIQGFDISDTRCVYTQHEPWLKHIINSVYNDVLSTEDYPYAHWPTNSATHEDSAFGPLLFPRDIIVFTVGGFTFEEVKLVQSINNRQVPNAAPRRAGFSAAFTRAVSTEKLESAIDSRVTLAGPTVLNAMSFLDAVMRQPMVVPVVHQRTRSDGLTTSSK